MSLDQMRRTLREKNKILGPAPVDDPLTILREWLTISFENAAQQFKCPKLSSSPSPSLPFSPPRPHPFSECLRKSTKRRFSEPRQPKKTTMTCISFGPP